MDRFPIPASATYHYAQNFSVAHRGTDIMSPLDTPIVAVEAGTAWATIDDKGGNVVYLDGSSGNRYYYAHLSSWSPLLLVTSDPKVAVDAGAELGKVGKTGNASKGPPHLHFQMRRGSLVIDPFDSLQAVDPHRERGSRAKLAIPAGVLLLAIIWFARR